MPLTDNGFEMPEYDDILADIKLQMKKTLGAEIDISEGSFMGMIAHLWADDKQEDLQYMQEIYDNSFVDSASGISLDRLGAIAGVQRKQAQYAKATLQITGQAGYLIEANTEFTTDNGDTFLTDENVQIDQDGKATVITHSDESGGYTNVEANTIINQTNPVDEIEEVTNPEQATGGEDLETDYDLRNRLKPNIKSAEGPTTDGIRTAILNVNGVKGVTIQVNNTLTTDSHGNPPNTIHVFVSGGDPQEIAEKLVDTIAGGATTVGKQNYHIDVYGNDVQVNFDLAQNKPIYFKLDLNTNTNFDEDAVKQSLLDFVNDLEMGDTIILNKLYGYLYQLSGIDTVNNIQAGRSPENLSSEKVILENFEIASTNDDIIEVISNE